MEEKSKVINTVMKHTGGVVVTALALKGATRTVDEGLSPDLPLGEKIVPAALDFFNQIPGLNEILPTVQDGKFTELDGYMWPTMIVAGAVTYGAYVGVKKLVSNDQALDQSSPSQER